MQDAEKVQALNETGELEKLLENYPVSKLAANMPPVPAYLEFRQLFAKYRSGINVNIY